jgi:hypothetical protein
MGFKNYKKAVIFSIYQILQGPAAHKFNTGSGYTPLEDTVSL